MILSQWYVTRSLKRLHQYDPERGSFSAWMFGIARNVMNDYFRDLARQADDVSLESLPAVQGRGDSPEERLIRPSASSRSSCYLNISVR